MLNFAGVVKKEITIAGWCLVTSIWTLTNKWVFLVVEHQCWFQYGKATETDKMGTLPGMRLLLGATFISERAACWHGSSFMFSSSGDITKESVYAFVFAEETNGYKRTSYEQYGRRNVADSSSWEQKIWLVPGDYTDLLHWAYNNPIWESRHEPIHTAVNS